MARLGSTTTARARQMRRVLRRWERSGLTLKAFGERARIAPTTLVWWRHVFRHAGRRQPRQRTPNRAGRRVAPAPPRFVELTAAAAQRGAPAMLEVLLRSGHVLRLPAGFDATALRAVVRALEAPC